MKVFNPGDRVIAYYADCDGMHHSDTGTIDSIAFPLIEVNGSWYHVKQCRHLKKKAQKLKLSREQVVRAMANMHHNLHLPVSKRIQSVLTELGFNPPEETK